MASISSRILRLPRSAQIAEPPAPAMSSAVTIGLGLAHDRQHAGGTGEGLRADLPATGCPAASAMTAPNGMETSIVGRIVTLAMNQACCDELAGLERPLDVMPADVEEEREQAAGLPHPADRGRDAPSARPGPTSLLRLVSARGPPASSDVLGSPSWAGSGQGVQHLEDALACRRVWRPGARAGPGRAGSAAARRSPPRALGAGARPRAAASWSIARQLGGELGGVLLLGHADRALACGR